MKHYLSNSVIESDFLKEVSKRSKQDIQNCYQCGKCSAGCPINYQMDYQPNEIMRMLQLGMKEQVLQTKTIWLCISCKTCTTRCPRENDLARVMDTLRSICLEEYQKGNLKQLAFFKQIWNEGLKSALRLGSKWDVNTFNEVFLENVRKYGRSFETTLMGGFNNSTLYLFRNILKAPTMVFKGKIRFTPERIKGVAKIREIMKKIEDYRLRD